MRIGKSFGLVIVLASSIATVADADEREEYLLCVTDELDRGTDLSEIGNFCLKHVRPAEDQRRLEKDEEQYPYKEALRRVFVIEGSLFDPGSAQFKDVVYNSRFRAWCGQINSKNRYGGYVGWEYFALRDRYRGVGKRKDDIDIDIGVKELIERKCKIYQAWDRNNW